MVKISVRVNGSLYGVFEGKNREEALDTHAKDMGYKNYEDLLEQMGEPKDQEITEISETDTIVYYSDSRGNTDLGIIPKDIVDWANEKLNEREEEGAKDEMLKIMIGYNKNYGWVIQEDDSHTDPQIEVEHNFYFSTMGFEEELVAA